ncbi:MAG: NAD(P)H-hydrate dehydratase [Actinomycetota bacterium]
MLTPEEVAELDRRSVAAGTPEVVLVERAGAAVARAAVRMLGGTYGRRVVVVCGTGNNGADGRVAARRLRVLGVGVDMFDLAAGIADLPRAVRRANLAIDAMFGTGFRGELVGDAARACELMAGLPTLAIDIPSGVDGTSGERRGTAVRADETVCFVARKPGLLFEPGRSLAGYVRVVDIGIGIPERPRLAVPGVGDLVLPVRTPTAHKWDAALMVVGGSNGMIGAPMMVANAAARSGAGMIVCGLPGSETAAAALGTEIVTRALPATADGHIDEDAARVVLKDLGPFAAIAIGPGLGRDDRAHAAARRIIAEAPVPLVVDADALNALATDPSPLRIRHAAKLPFAILTPHEGEFERLAGRPVGADRVAAARALATRTDAIVLLKGPGTVIAAPDGDAVINPTGTAALATAGTGDILTGIIGGLLANGAEPFVAALTGAYVHGRAACAAPTAPDLVAMDLIGALAPTLSALRSGHDPWED